MASVVDFFNGIQNFSYGQYCATGANEYAAVMLLHLGTIVFILGKLTGDYSWVDRVWSLLPIGFAVHLIFYQIYCLHIPISFRQIIMATFITLWGLRLTYNFFRKGGYSSGGEDYRWAYIRKNFPKHLVELLNFFFTSYYQLFLIYWFTTPIFYASSPVFSIYDVILSIAWLLLFSGEIIADNQQFAFQQTKHKTLKQNGNSLANLPQPYKRGFITDGLFKYSRHPNFFCEIAMWYVIYLFSVVSDGWNLSGLGAILLNMLFLGSTALTEIISKQKYPAYGEYQKHVSKLIPSLPKQKEKDY